MSNIPADSKYRFYMKKGAPEQQKGLYMLLHEKKQIPIDRIKSFIDEWDAEHGSRCGKRQGWSKRDTMQTISSNQGMEQLLAIVTKHTGIVFKKNPLSKEDKPVKLVNNEGETNVSVEWQGNFRTGILDLDLLKYAIDCDSIYAGTARKNLVVTCLDQTGESFYGTVGGKEVSLDPDKLVDFLSPEPFHTLLTSSSPHTERVTKRQYSL